MPSGHASHKGTGDKPNTNAEGRMDMAADKTVNPEDELLYQFTIRNSQFATDKF